MISLAEKYPEIAKEWHPTKNGSLTPDKVAACSNKKVWWYVPYNDPETKKHFDFEWQTSINNRTSGGSGCPFLSGKAILKGYNDLATLYPDIANEWHPTKNGSLTPDQVTANSGKKVWWYLPYDDPKTGKHFDFEWQAKVETRTTRGYQCPFLSGGAVWQGYNDLATLYPELTKEWHPTKNGSLTPDKVATNSGKKVWWYLPYDDPKTGKHFDFEWKTNIIARTKYGGRCPFLSGEAIWQGYNDLATQCPEIAKEWHPTKNGSLTPDKVAAYSNKKAWWLLPYDDPKTGKHFDFEWQAIVESRTAKGNQCPFLSGQAVWQGYNDLATLYPELTMEWHPTKNGSLTPDKVAACSSKKVWWYLPYDDPKTGKHFDFEWQTIVASRTANGYQCPFLSGQAVWQGYNDLATLYPEIAKEWHPTKNGSLTPDKVTAYSNKKVWWCLPYDDPKTGDHFVFEWETSVVSRTRLGCGCPYLPNLEPKGEKYTAMYLDKVGLNYRRQVRFSDLKGEQSCLSYDFELVSAPILIEYNGKQHYQPVNFFGGEPQYKKQKAHDLKKAEYAKNKGYHLIAIPYTCDSQEKVEQFLQKHLIPLLPKEKSKWKETAA